MDWLINFSSWKKAGVLLSFNFALQAIILLIIYPLISTSIEPLDVQVGLTSESIIYFFNEIGMAGREYYFLNEITVDMLFPLVYSFAYSLLLIELIKSCNLIGSPLKYLALLPFGIGISDIIENIHILTAIHSYPEQSDLLIKSLFIANMSKHSLTVFVLSVVFLLICWLVGMKVNRRLKQSR
ncbi:MAG: hypothetical protein V7735_25005 [Photobacterium frigidiphilum]|uniref:hypothetical protein n=1 Tax=Photobacterium frigidiphilum TaxID=264736 RepID=UPI0030033258